jgi:hypothetical protein
MIIETYLLIQYFQKKQIENQDQERKLVQNTTQSPNLQTTIKDFFLTETNTPTGPGLFVSLIGAIIGIAILIGVFYMLIKCHSEGCISTTMFIIFILLILFVPIVNIIVIIYILFIYFNSCRRGIC